MALLSAQDRQDAQLQAMREIQWTGPITKAQLLTTINEIDAWVDANSTAFNNAISQPARGILSTKEKAALLLFVVERRFKVA